MWISSCHLGTVERVVRKFTSALCGSQSQSHSNLTSGPATGISGDAGLMETRAASSTCLRSAWLAVESNVYH
ncbi:hypothetical protein BaRGS_00013107 [Batillaria attramentaria]|uniref:Uncharacterized protein n=1 Tax=Batillaria attramentaria TaxID=370345 RepID=A0ABD0L8N9_9CAEN